MPWEKYELTTYARSVILGDYTQSKLLLQLITIWVKVSIMQKELGLVLGSFWGLCWVSVGVSYY